MKRLIAQFLKFGVVGVLAFVVDFGLLFVLTSGLGVNYLVSATASFSASVVFNYAASMRYVFTHREDLSRRREFVVFVALSVVGLVINNATMALFVEVFAVNYLVAKVVATAIVILWNFFSRKKWLDGGAEGAGADVG
ncbi:GtrA family protein [Xiamenia xianingshaonis]|uniref:GtrA family protein n=1 Tax=Xiamenia xianingshaonis TaxID=2682776 RepID=A0A9E6SV02_9ACTN|nr:GtrA family protein [Xiamenia xianingshaonis]NHM14584.1 GtrA family protein [Xiamenia xianingshaonis]QTU84969.1 GtrA family protein [Xiamenia xianingshaonis]